MDKKLPWEWILWCFRCLSRTGKLFVNHLSGCLAACWGCYPLDSSRILSLVQTTKSVSKIVRTTALGGHRCEYFTIEVHGREWFFCYFVFQVLTLVIGIPASYSYSWASLVAPTVKNPPAVRVTCVQSLGQEDPREKGWQATSVFLPGESHGQRSLVGYNPWCCRVMMTWLMTFPPLQLFYSYSVFFSLVLLTS